MRGGGWKIEWLSSSVCAAFFVASSFAIFATGSAHGLDPKSVHSSTVAKTIAIHAERQSSTDLAVTGMLAGLPDGAVGYVRAADLASLPKVTVRIRGDENFYELPTGHSVMVTGIYLDVLARALGALPTSDLMDATCRDDYRGHFPTSYVATHKPILGLAVNHEPVSQWATLKHKFDPGPYFVVYENFVPAFKVLAHVDRPQLPANIVRLNFSTIAATYGAIAPRGTFVQNSPEEQGFSIAKQNCLRCHNQGPYGGTKAGRTWTTLSTWAREQPAYFENYVQNPKQFELRAKMPPNPEYDRSTLDALAAYFRTFTAPPSEKTN